MITVEIEQYMRPVVCSPIAVLGSRANSGSGGGIQSRTCSVTGMVRPWTDGDAARLKELIHSDPLVELSR